MGYRSTHLSTFDDVRNWYEKTQPVVSHIHAKEDDIRPIGNRSRKWERIEKINNNCYALLGSYGFDGINYYGKRGVEDRITGIELKRTAPIVWERNPKTGEEFVTVHNAANGYATSLYEFFRSRLPRGLHMPQSRDGRQWVTCGNEKYYLPHNIYVAKPKRETCYRLKGKELADASKPSAERKLVFKRVGNEFVLVSEPYVLVHKAKTVVDRTEKSALRAEIREFKNYVMATAPLFWDMSPADRHIQQRELIAQVTDDVFRGWGQWYRRMDAEHVRRALTDTTSPLRLALVYEFIQYSKNCDWYVSRDREGAADLQKSRLNTFVNEAFHFSKPNK